MSFRLFFITWPYAISTIVSMTGARMAANKLTEQLVIIGHLTKLQKKKNVEKSAWHCLFGLLWLYSFLVFWLRCQPSIRFAASSSWFQNYAWMIASMCMHGSTDKSTHDLCRHRYSELRHRTPKRVYMCAYSCHQEKKKREKWKFLLYYFFFLVFWIQSPNMAI